VQGGGQAGQSGQGGQNQIGNVNTGNITALTNWAVGIFINPIIIAVIIILLLAGAVARAGGTEIGLIALITGIAVFTIIVPVFPPQILAVIGVAAGVIFGLRIVRK
jgi:hypothetical protein